MLRPRVKLPAAQAPTVMRLLVTLLSLFRLELINNWRRFALLAALSGLSNAAVLATINRAAVAPDRNGLGLALVMLVVSILIYRIAQRGLMVEAAGLAENTVSE